MCNVYKPPQAICDDMQGTLLDLDTDNGVPATRPNNSPQKQITAKEQLTVDIMKRLLQDNPKLDRKEALKKARECVGE